jgi:hypothetical protein
LYFIKGCFILTLCCFMEQKNTGSRYRVSHEVSDALYVRKCNQDCNRNVCFDLWCSWTIMCWSQNNIHKLCTCRCYVVSVSRLCCSVSVYLSGRRILNPLVLELNSWWKLRKTISFIRKAIKCHYLQVALGILASHFVMAIPVYRCQRVELIPRVMHMWKEHFWCRSDKWTIIKISKSFVFWIEIMSSHIENNILYPCYLLCDQP